MPEAELSLNKTKKLNIAIVCDAITDYTAGVYVSTLRFSELLKNQGHKVIFIAARSKAFPTDNEHNGMKVYRFPSFLLPKTEGKVYLALPRPSAIKKILQEEKIDIVHCILPAPSTFAAVRAAKSLGIKIVSHSHAQPENLSLALPAPLLLVKDQLGKVYDLYLSWIYGKAHAVVYPTQFAKDILTPLAKSIKTEVISNGIDTSKFKPKDASGFFAKYNLPLGKQNAIFVGRLHPEKGINVLIKAISVLKNKLPDAHAWIVGVGHMEKELKKLAVDLGVADKVYFLGKISDEDLVDAYNAADIFVLPSHCELEGMVVLEAMACGKPILISDTFANASRFFVNNNGYTFKHLDHQDLANKIEVIFSNKELQNAMGQQSLVSSQHYDIYKSLEKLENLYYSLI